VYSDAHAAPKNIKTSLKERQHVVFIKIQHMSIITAHFLDGRGHLLVSCHWSDSPWNRLLVPFQEGDMMPFLQRSLDILCALPTPYNVFY
jgi:hypothetical protein